MPATIGNASIGDISNISALDLKRKQARERDRYASLSSEQEKKKTGFKRTASGSIEGRIQLQLKQLYANIHPRQVLLYQTCTPVYSYLPRQLSLRLILHPSKVSIMSV